MWEFFKSLVGRLSGGFLEMLILIIIAAALYYIPKIRWNKNGKPYIYSESYEHQKNKIHDIQDSIAFVKEQLNTLHNEFEQSLFEMRKSTLRQEILLLMHTDPSNTDAICKSYDKYHAERASGGFEGNSWMSEMFAAWKKKHMNKGDV